MELNFSDQLKFLKELQATIEEEVSKRIKSFPVNRYQSDCTKDLAEALSKAQGEFKPLRFNRESNWFAAEFCDLDNIMKMVLPIISKYGLSLYFYEEISDATILHTVLKHSSDQWQESRARLVPSKDDPKTLESARNHLKRQQVMNILAITLEGDLLDDDAYQEMTTKREDVVKGTPSTKVVAKDYDGRTITKEQLNELEYELTDFPGIAEQILKAYRLQHIADLPYSKYQTAITRVRELKEATKGLKN